MKYKSRREYQLLWFLRCVLSAVMSHHILGHFPYGELTSSPDMGRLQAVDFCTSSAGKPHQPRSTGLGGRGHLGPCCCGGPEWYFIIQTLVGVEPVVRDSCWVLFSYLLTVEICDPQKKASSKLCVLRCHVTKCLIEAEDGRCEKVLRNKPCPLETPSFHFVQQQNKTPWLTLHGTFF